MSKRPIWFWPKSRKQRAMEAKVLDTTGTTKKKVAHKCGAIIAQSTGLHAIKSATFTHSRPGADSAPEVKFPATKIETDERIVATSRQTGLPIQHRRYSAVLEDGKTMTGVTDEHGRTELMQHDGIGIGTFTLEAEVKTSDL